MDFKIEHDKIKHQFFAVVDGKTCLIAYEELEGGKILNMFHTFTPPELRGRKIMETIVTFALDYARSNNLKVIPTCPYFEYYLQIHKEYNDVIVMG